MADKSLPPTKPIGADGAAVSEAVGELDIVAQAAARHVSGRQPTTGRQPTN